MTRTRRIAQIGIAAAAALALSSCSLIGAVQTLLPGGGPSGGGGGGEAEEKRMQPFGDPGAWLLPAYADGIGETWATDRTICGIGADSSTVLTFGMKNDDFEVSATDLATGEELWSSPSAMCVEDAVDGDTALFAQRTRGATDTFTARQVDLRTGETIAEADMPGDLRTVALIGADDERVYFQIITETANAFAAMTSDGELVWSTDPKESGKIFDCHLLDGAVACFGGLEESWVMDAATGETTATLDPDLLMYYWASDGYLTMDENPGNTLYDFSGTEIGTIDTASPPDAPTAEDGVFVRLADFRAGIDAIDAEGRPAIRVNSDFSKAFTATGKPITEKELDISAAIVGISSDGRAAVFTEDPMATEVVLSSADRGEIARIPMGGGQDPMSGQEVSVQGGLLVTVKEEGGIVHLPQGY